MDPFETKVIEILEKRKKIAETIVNKTETKTEIDDSVLPFNISKTTRHIENHLNH